MRGLKQLRCARVIIAGHAFIQNIRRGHYELGDEKTVNLRVLAAFDELVMAIRPTSTNDLDCSHRAQRKSPARGGRLPARRHTVTGDNSSYTTTSGT